jgi:outer membrane protein assembly factor BamB
MRPHSPAAEGPGGHSEGFEEMNRSVSWKLAWAAVAVPGALALAAADWPRFNGPNRDNRSSETGLLKSWPEGGPKLLWASPVDLGGGFSSVSVANGTIYTTGIVDRQEHLFALDLVGKLKWKKPYGPGWTRSHGGARSTPTIYDGRAYVFSGSGRAVCFDAADGELKWAIDTFKTFGGRNISWGVAESPLVFDDKMICTPGGKDASVVALDRKTGATTWTTKGLSDRAAYCSPLLIDEPERRLIVTVLSHHIVGIAPDDGKVLWQHPYHGQCAAHPNTPIYHEGSVYVTSGYNEGGVKLKLSADGTRIETPPAWTDKTLDTHHGGVVLVDGYLYGSSWRGNNNGNWVCVDWKTGKPTYDTHWRNKGSITFADGMLYCYEERGGTVALVKATPEKFDIVSTFSITRGSGRHWAHPVICDGRLYIRHGAALMAFDVKARGEGAAATKRE